ncbi:MAG: hypothetical protein GFH27_549347n58 [Chloroflexi bacterium AL-W]|nr:hypothetical protein [Chloroflexi bacterium AL-N1]NOK70840.1 hypothetical protein [Chloroflexi bacterium AL-N10]NOK78400.1 hypothetical protein [Chloroflexi bacterium AL-N5]NOK85381.1 hypothetical protein [Chloroflexi bacterium AL-W]NOK92657.1 hypothetical protein [Chloroflexi bacterium AL-N15]
MYKLNPMRYQNVRQVGLGICTGIILTLVVFTQLSISFANTTLKAPPPLLAPPDPSGYTKQPVDNPNLTVSDGPRVQLNSAVSDRYFEAESYQIDSKPEIAADEEWYSILNSVIYTASDHTLLVSVTQPSKAALAEARPLGDKEIRLGSGSLAWVSTDMGGEFPTRVIFFEDDLIITVASQLPLDNVQEIANNIEFKP